MLTFIAHEAPQPLVALLIRVAITLAFHTGLSFGTLSVLFSSRTLAHRYSCCGIVTEILVCEAAHVCAPRYVSRNFSVPMETLEASLAMGIVKAIAFAHFTRVRARASSVHVHNSIRR